MKKLLAILLCFVLFAACFAACGKAEEEQSKEEPVSTEQSAVSAEESSEPVSNDDPTQKILDNPDIYKGNDYTGRTFKILTSYSATTMPSEFVYNLEVAEEVMSDTVNQAIKRRNDNVYDLLGVTIVDEYYYANDRYGGMAPMKVRQIISDADDSYSMFSVCLYDCGTLALEGDIWNLKELDNINTENPWWDQYFNESVTIANQLFFTTGDIGIFIKGCTPCVYYNTRLMEDLGLEDPINLAVRGEWTIDKAIEYSKAMPHEDLPPTEQYKHTFGWSGQYDDVYAMMFGSGTRVLSRDAEGYLTLTLESETAVNAINKIVEFMIDSSYMCGNDLFVLSNTPMDLLNQAFQEGRCLFASGGIDGSITLHMDDVVGVLPVPKLTAEQDHYYSLVNTWVGNGYFIAANLGKDDAEFAAAVMDAMGYYSWIKYPDSVAYNYYEKMIKAQRTAREDSEAMLDLIFEARGCEL
ncbi:MAG: hypothetical protein J5760_03365, partial [Clostridia bacterium]|nr:hypothetical protein [Clostridia bacterium]